MSYKNFVKDYNISNSNINYISYSRRNNKKIKSNLSESLCTQIQKALRNDYFNRLYKISEKQRPNYIYDYEIKLVNKNIKDIYQRPRNFESKKLLFSNRIRKDNYNKIKNNKKKILNNSALTILSNKININKLDKEKYEELLDENKRKSPLPLIEKKCKDDKTLYYDLNYIDDVENKYIKPYLSRNNIKYKEYIENKKSKAPFNFIIG